MEIDAAHPVVDAGEQAMNHGDDAHREIGELPREVSRNEPMKSGSVNVALLDEKLRVDGARDRRR
jgi:hypothetical protein